MTIQALIGLYGPLMMALWVLPTSPIVANTFRDQFVMRWSKLTMGLANPLGGLLTQSVPMVLSDLWFDQERLRRAEYAVVEFWSLRCETCRIMAPVVSEMADRLDDRLVVFKFNADDSPRMVSKFQVPLVPYLILFCYGEPIARFAECWSIAQIESELELQGFLLNAAA